MISLRADLRFIRKGYSFSNESFYFIFLYLESYLMKTSVSWKRFTYPKELQSDKLLLSRVLFVTGESTETGLFLEN